MKYSNQENCSKSGFDGVIDVRIIMHESSDGFTRPYVALSMNAVEEGALRTPGEPFSEKTHQSYVKMSQAAMRVKRMEETERRLGQAGLDGKQKLDELQYE